MSKILLLVVIISVVYLLFNVVVVEACNNGNVGFCDSMGLDFCDVDFQEDTDGCYDNTTQVCLTTFGIFDECPTANYTMCAFHTPECIIKGTSCARAGCFDTSEAQCVDNVGVVCEDDWLKLCAYGYHGYLSKTFFTQCYMNATEYCDPIQGVMPIVDEYSESPLIVSSSVADVLQSSSEQQQELSSNLIVASSSAIVVPSASETTPSASETTPSASETTGVRVSSSSSVFSLSHLILATLTSIVVCYWWNY
jgi:hypothetical protein